VTTITFDIETLKFFNDTAIKRMPREAQFMALEFGCAVAFIDDERRDYEGQMGAIDLWNDLMQADTIVTFNGLSFDLPLVAFEYARATGGYPGWPPATQIDLLDIPKQATGRWYKLEELAQANLGRGKTADGFKAAEWLRSGDPVQMRQALDYCAEDVRLTAALWRLCLDELLILPPQPAKKKYDGYLLAIDPHDGQWTQLHPQWTRAGAQWVLIHSDRRTMSGVGEPPKAAYDDWIVCRIADNGTWTRDYGED
jgi:hypothetical protein